MVAPRATVILVFDSSAGFSLLWYKESNPHEFCANLHSVRECKPMHVRNLLPTNVAISSIEATASLHVLTTERRHH